METKTKPAATEKRWGCQYCSKPVRCTEERDGAPLYLWWCPSCSTSTHGAWVEC